MIPSSRTLLVSALPCFALVLLVAAPALATPGGTAMPWDTPLINLLNNLQGTVSACAQDCPPHCVQ